MAEQEGTSSVEARPLESSQGLIEPGAKPQESSKETVDKAATPRGSGRRDRDALYIGIDLGTSRTSVSASNGARHSALSCVGYCRDVVSEKRLGRRVLVGNKALQNRLALEIVRPLKKGVIDESEPRALPAVRELLRHVIGLCKPRHKQSICGVIGAPARASLESQQVILQAVEPLLESVMVVSEPFAVAYGLNVLSEALIIDIGAGTIDLCRMHGTLPEESDQITLMTGGNAVDERLEQEILKRYPKVQLTRNMVRKLKEKFGFVSDPHQKCEATLTEMGRPKRVDITDPLRTACQSILPDIVEAISQLIATFDPEFQAQLRRSVILAGGGSRLGGLALLLERELKAFGGGNVVAVEEPLYAGSNGGLKLAMEMPARYWKALV